MSFVICAILAGIISFLLDVLLNELFPTYRKHTRNWIRITAMTFVIVLVMIF